ncbi:MAG: phosphoribosyltransferase [Parcubacteria group bacterium]
MFADRAEAGRLLAERLERFKAGKPIVYALPRGGVTVALEVAKTLDAPLDLLLVRKLGAPRQPELGVGAVAEGPEPFVYLDRALCLETGADDDFIERSKRRELDEIERRRKLYLGDRLRPDPRGRTAIVVDDGLATGGTARAAIGALRKAGASQIVLAVPVAPPDTAAAMREVADEVVCLDEPAMFWGVGAFYYDFHQVSDEEVLRLLKAAPGSEGTRPAPGR